MTTSTTWWCPIPPGALVELLKRLQPSSDVKEFYKYFGYGMNLFFCRLNNWTISRLAKQYWIHLFQSIRGTNFWKISLYIRVSSTALSLPYISNHDGGHGWQKIQCGAASSRARTGLKSNVAGMRLRDYFRGNSALYFGRRCWRRSWKSARS